MLLEIFMIPCCYHPTRVVVIDDNSSFLGSLNRVLSKNQASYLYYSNPQKALHDINNLYTSNPFPNRYIQNADEEQWQHRRLDINIFDTHHEIYRPERFEEVSTVIIDHSMPEMTGLEFCARLENPNIQKILLTGEAEEHIAIRAFNEGLIHHYIRKQDADMSLQINQAVENAQWRYFNRLSEVALKAISAVDIVDHAVLDPNFHNFFKKLIKDHDFREAYICDTMGSYLFITEDAQVFGLVVNIAEELDIWADAGQSLKIPNILLQGLRDRKKMICYHNSRDVREPKASEWEKYAYPVQTLEGVNRTYYYAFTPNIFDIDHARILAFEKHRDSLVLEVK